MRPEYELDNGKKYPIIWRKKGSDKTDNCPYCNKQHFHGRAEGHRLAHCTDTYNRRDDKIIDSDSYTCILSDGDVIGKTNGYILREYHD